MVGVNISQSMHPAGIIASPITLKDNYGTMLNEDKIVLQLDMENAHTCGLIKYDVLGLKTVGVVKRTYQYLEKKYPKMHEIDWDDKDVWKEISNDNTAIFQFESNSAGKLLKKMQPRNLFDLSLVNACVRPSGASYRDKLTNHEVNYNPDERVAELLSDSYGFLVYQEQQIKFLQEICGLSGSQADTVRRAIGKKDKKVIDAWLPKILEGYCNGSNKTKDEATKEAEQYLRILEDAASYSFGYNHSISYSMLGYICGYLKYHHPEEFICAFLNCAKNEDDINNGTKLAKLKNIRIVEPRFRYSKSEYFFNKEQHLIYKGISSVKFLNERGSEELYKLRNNNYNNFMELLLDIDNLTSLNSRQLEILIKLDFFREFGNSAELYGMNTMFDFFKQGKAKSISKDKINNEIIYNIIARNSRETEKKFTILNMKNILNEIHDFIKSQSREDFTYKQKITFQLEYLGYINLCTNSTDINERKKLIVTDVFASKAKKGKQAGQIWAYIISTQSIGSGKNGRFTILTATYKKEPIKKMDIIFADEIHQKDGYWYIGEYHHLL